MGMQVGDRSGGPMADINVTPLVDVVLVLLIIFMVVTPMLVSGVDVKLPMAQQGIEIKDDGQHLIVSIDEENRIFVGRTEFELEDVAEEMKRLMEEEDQKNGDPIGTAQNGIQGPKGIPAKQILIKADQTVPWKEVYPVLEEIRAQLGRKDIILATDDPRAH